MLANWLPWTLGGWLGGISVGSFSTAVMCLGSSSGEVLGGGSVYFGGVGIHGGERLVYVMRCWLGIY